MSMSDTHHSVLSPGLSAQPAGGPVAGQDPRPCLCLTHTTLPYPQVSQHNLLAAQSLVRILGCVCLIHTTLSYPQVSQHNLLAAQSLGRILGCVYV